MRFVKLAGTPTAGSFVAIAPQRAYDSRISRVHRRTGVLAPNTSRVVSVANGHSAGRCGHPGERCSGRCDRSPDQPDGRRPDRAELPGRAAGDATTTTTSLLNWNLGVTQIANSITVKFDADREIKVFCGDQAGSTHFIVDVFGYYI